MNDDKLLGLALLFVHRIWAVSVTNILDRQWRIQDFGEKGDTGDSQALAKIISHCGFHLYMLIPSIIELRSTFLENIKIMLNQLTVAN